MLIKSLLQLKIQEEFLFCNSYIYLEAKEAPIYTVCINNISTENTWDGSDVGENNMNV